MDKGIKYIDEIDIAGKRLFVRVDFNVPVDKEGNILDDLRIKRVLPTINYCIDEGAKVIIASHMDRPGGKKIKRYSMKNVAKRLSRYLAREVIFKGEVIGEKIKKTVENMKEGDALLLENLRFHPGETSNDQKFARDLASLADVYVNDAFAVCHRAHASMVSVPKYVKEKAGGFLLRRELSYFRQLMQDPGRPFCAIIGGAKVDGKMKAIDSLVERVDKLLLGGAMAFPFLRASGFNTGKFKISSKAVKTAKNILKKALKKGVRVYLPVDWVVADRISQNADVEVVTFQEVPPNWYAVDIGPATITLFTEALKGARTIVWNGPMGIFEIDQFSKGTYAMVSVLASSYALTVVGGGDTDVAVTRTGHWSSISYISTGGGAFIHLLEGRELPGIKALKWKR